MEGRETTEIVLPKSNARVVLYTYLTFGEQRKIKRVAYDAMQLQVTNIDRVKKDADLNIKDISGSFKLDADDLTVFMMVQSAYNTAGELVTDVKAFIDDLPTSDGDLLYAKINELSEQSTLSEEETKK